MSWKKMPKETQATVACNLRRIIESFGVDASHLTDNQLLETWNSDCPDPESKQDAEDYVEEAEGYEK